MPLLLHTTCLFLMLAGCWSANHQPVNSPNNAAALLTIPAAPAPTLDGKIDEGEWAQALRQDLEKGGQLHLQHNGDFLFVALQGVEPGWGHVYALDDDSLRVMHASAALGMAVYYERSGIWQPAREFVWTMRDASLNEAAQAARASYLDTQGWVATIGEMGTPEVIEYQIDKRLLGSASVLAAVYAATPEVPLYWPASLQDGTLDAGLVRGTTPETLPFDTSHWQQISFAP